MTRQINSSKLPFCFCVSCCYPVTCSEGLHSCYSVICMKLWRRWTETSIVSSTLVSLGPLDLYVITSRPVAHSLICLPTIRKRFRLFTCLGFVRDGHLECWEVQGVAKMDGFARSWRKLARALVRFQIQASLAPTAAFSTTLLHKETLFFQTKPYCRLLFTVQHQDNLIRLRTLLQRTQTRSHKSLLIKHAPAGKVGQLSRKS